MYIKLIFDCNFCNYKKKNMIVKQLNGDLLEFEFDRPIQTIFDICERIWDFQKIEFEKDKEKDEKCEEKDKKYFNHFVFEREDGEKITINEFDSEFDFNKDELFVDQNIFSRKRGHNRQIDTSCFSLCHALFIPKKEKILVYCTGKNNFRCIDLHDFSFHMDSSRVIVNIVNDSFGYRSEGKGKVINNDQIKMIDYDSILSHYPKSFKAGSRVFEDTGTKIETYLSRVIRGFQPTYIARDASRRSGYDHKKIIKYCF